MGEIEQSESMADMREWEALAKTPQWEKVRGLIETDMAVEMRVVLGEEKDKDLIVEAVHRMRALNSIVHFITKASVTREAMQARLEREMQMVAQRQPRAFQTGGALR